MCLVGVSRHCMRYDGVSFRWSTVGERGGEDDAGSFVLCVPNSIGEYFVVGFVRYEKRTEAAHVYYWFTRLALVFGPCRIVLPVHYGVRLFAGVSVALLLCAGVLIVTMCVPFRLLWTVMVYIRPFLVASGIPALYSSGRSGLFRRIDVGAIPGCRILLVFGCRFLVGFMGASLLFLGESCKRNWQ